MEINIDEVKEIKINMWQKETGHIPKRCIVEIESPVSSDFVVLYIDGVRYEYYAKEN